MKRRTIIGIIVTYIVVMVGVYIALLHGRNIQVFSPEGTIADQEKNLIIFTVLLGVTIVIPVIVLALGVAWHYREGNEKAVYKPDWGGSRIAESIWWGVPTIVIAILAVVIVQSSHALDPFRSLDSNVKPVNIQVVALDWRWLFIYPDEKVASINYFKFPVNTPVNFTITSDAPMNSFWIPQLSGQIYAMSGMSTQLHIAARNTGDYRGSSANISGVGFADMKFTASAVSKNDYVGWVSELRVDDALDSDSYEGISQKTCDPNQYSYKLADPNLYNEIINKYMDPSVATPPSSETDASSAPANCQSDTIPQTIQKQLLGSR